MEQKDDTENWKEKAKKDRKEKKNDGQGNDVERKLGGFVTRG